MRSGLSLYFATATAAATDADSATDADTDADAARICLQVVDLLELLGIGEIAGPCRASLDREKLIEGNDGHLDVVDAGDESVVEDLSVADILEAGQEVDPVRFFAEVDCPSFLLEEVTRNSRGAESELNQSGHDPIGIVGGGLDQQVEVLGVPHIAVVVHRVCR